MKTMFIAVVNDQTVRWCDSLESVNDMISDLIKGLPKGKEVAPVSIDVFVKIGSYTTKIVESWPKKKIDSGIGVPV